MESEFAKGDIKLKEEEGKETQVPSLQSNQIQGDPTSTDRENLASLIEQRKNQIAFLQMELDSQQSETYSTAPEYIASKTRASLYEKPFSLTESISLTKRPWVLSSRRAAISRLPEKSVDSGKSLEVYEKLLFLREKDWERENEGIWYKDLSQDFYTRDLLDFYSNKKLVSKILTLNRETHGNLENSILNLLTLGYSAQNIVRVIDDEDNTNEDNANNEYLLNILSQADNKLLKNTLQANISNIPITYYNLLLTKVHSQGEREGYSIVLQNLLRNETNNEYVEYIKTFYDAKFLENNCSFPLEFPYQPDPPSISAAKISEFVQDYSAAETVVASIALDNGSSVITSESTQLVEQPTDKSLVVQQWRHFPSETKRVLGNVVGLGVSISDLSCSSFPRERELATLTENLKHLEMFFSEEANFQYLGRLSREFGINAIEVANLQLLSYLTSDEGKTLVSNLNVIQQDLAFQNSQDFFSIKEHKIEIDCEQIKKKLQGLQQDSPIQDSIYYKLIRDATEIPSSELVLFILQNKPDNFVSEGKKSLFKSFLNYEDRLYHSEIPLNVEKREWRVLNDNPISLDTLAENGIPTKALSALYSLSSYVGCYEEERWLWQLRKDAEKWIDWSSGERLNYSFLQDLAGNWDFPPDTIKTVFDKLNENFLDISKAERAFFKAVIELPTRIRKEVVNTAPDINMLREENVKRFLDFYVNVGSLSTDPPVWAEDSAISQILKKIVQGSTISQQEQSTLDTMYQIIEKWNKVHNPTFIGVSQILLPQIMESAKPLEAYKYIESIYTTENLPQILKSALASKHIYSIKDAKGEPYISKRLQIRDSDNLRLSPYLRQLPPKEAVNFFARSIVRNAIESGSPEVLSFLESFNKNKELLKQLDDDKTHSLEQKIQALNEKNLNLLSQFVSSVEWLLEIPSDTDLIIRLNNILLHTKASQFSEMTLVPTLNLAQVAGFKNSDEMYKFIQQKLEVSNTRNHLIAEQVIKGENVLLKGDYLKSINRHDLNSILRNGIHCGESINVCLGRDSRSGNTPFDADFGVIDAIDGDDAEIIQNSIVLASAMTTSNDVVLVIQDDQLVDTTDNENVTLNLGQRETFHSIYGDKQYKTGRKTHFGITEGTPSTNIKLVYLPHRFFQKEDAKKALTQIRLNLAFAQIFIPIKSAEGLEFNESDYNETQVYLQNINKYLHGETDQDLLDLCLSSSRIIKDVFELDSQTGEGYTLEEHTRSVLDRADRFFKNSFNETHLSYRDFQLLLTLHDIGKPFPENKNDQHRFTKEFCTQIVEKLDLPQSKKKLIIEVASQDIIGNMLKGGTDPYEAAQELKETSRICNISVEDLYYYCNAFFMCDAGAYTKDSDPTLEKGFFDDSFEFNYISGSSTNSLQGRMSIKNISWLTKIGELEKSLIPNN